MHKSEQINELATALAKAQAEIVGAKKDSQNPFFDSKYADLASCWDACRKPLSDNGLSIVQTVENGRPVTIQWEVKDKESGEVKEFKVDTLETVIVTLLCHSSGQWIQSDLPMIPRDASPQGVGSAITYGRRYGLTAMVGVAQVDDDGNTATHSNQFRQGHKKPANGAHAEPQGSQQEAADPDLVRAACKRMTDILAADVDETIKAGHVADETEALNKSGAIYDAAWKLMPSYKRTAWRSYLAMAQKIQANEPKGQRF